MNRGRCQRNQNSFILILSTLMKLPLFVGIAALPPIRLLIRLLMCPLKSQYYSGPTPSQVEWRDSPATIYGLRALGLPVRLTAPLSPLIRASSIVLLRDLMVHRNPLHVGVIQGINHAVNSYNASTYIANDA